MKVENKNVVTVNYILHTVEEDGSQVLVEKTTAEKPLTYLHGAGMMIPKFEEYLTGLEEGEKTTFTLAPEEAYGPINENAKAELPLDMFEQMGMPPVGAILPLSDNQGNNFQATVIEVNDHAVVADLNHPMAGKTLNFEVEVLKSRPATEEELAHGHAHGENGNEAHS